MDGAELHRLAEHALTDRPDKEQVRRRQAEIFAEVLRRSPSLNGPNFTRASHHDLQLLASLIDQGHFQGRLLPLAQSAGLAFSWSRRMTKNAGKTVSIRPRGRQSPRRFEIVVSSSLLFQTFRDVERTVTVSGLPCQNRLEALQRVMEHELTHLLEMIVWDASSCSREPFQGIARRLFGHQAFRHGLITQAERAARKYDIRVGHSVRFHFEGRTYVGVVNRITRRATVLVLDPGGEMYADGHRYRRFYVPLELLQRAGAE